MSNSVLTLSESCLQWRILVFDSLNVKQNKILSCKMEVLVGSTVEGREAAVLWVLLLAELSADTEQQHLFFLQWQHAWQLPGRTQIKVMTCIEWVRMQGKRSHGTALLKSEMWVWISRGRGQESVVWLTLSVTALPAPLALDALLLAVVPSTARLDSSSARLF